MSLHRLSDRRRRPPLDPRELAAAIVLLGSIPASIALLGWLAATFAGLGSFALVAPFLPPFIAALLLADHAFPTLLRAEVVRATLIATFSAVATFLVGEVLLSLAGPGATSVAGLVALGVYAGGGVLVVRDRLADERLWPAVGALAALVFWVLAVALG